MVRDALLDRVASSRPATAVGRHPRAVTTLTLLVVLVLASDTAAAAELTAGGPTVDPSGVGDVDNGP